MKVISIFSMVKIIEHGLVTPTLLDEIIEIKSVAWNYSFESHLNWINKNLNDSDLHFLVYESNEIIAYTNLVHITLEVNKKPIPVIGIGNVCTKYPGKGDGKRLFKYLNDYLMMNHLEGMLFCKTNLVPFYENLGWTLHENLHPDKSIQTLTFNFKERNGICLYNDRLF